ncbi:MAG: hypothetical protein KGJ89_01395 [Patescibacteria group bacterium]|nr:hypothetical protein [Patescibacteria group bacterium]MDE2015167.1 hypothetical protein [Patescibacteria group bacterium]MDE2226595.1 hypothetical protein [Patescibacteria group bacterium]
MKNEKIIVIYRANENLSAQVEKLNTVFKREFPASASIEDIARELPFLPGEIWEHAHGENLRNGCCILIDGTVWLAMRLTEKQQEIVPWVNEETGRYGDEHYRQIFVIRQDDAEKYEIYVDEIVKQSQGASKVILVRACIANHNSEGLEGSSDEYKISRKPERIEWVTNQWIWRLKARGITPVVIERLWADEEILSPELSPPDLKDAVVICDHHHNYWFTCEALQKRFGIKKLFNAFTLFHEFSFSWLEQSE